MDAMRKGSKTRDRRSRASTQLLIQWSINVQHLTPFVCTVMEWTLVICSQHEARSQHGAGAETELDGSESTNANAAAPLAMMCTCL